MIYTKIKKLKYKKYTHIYIDRNRLYQLTIKKKKKQINKYKFTK